VTVKALGPLVPDPHPEAGLLQTLRTDMIQRGLEQSVGNAPPPVSRLNRQFMNLSDSTALPVPPVGIHHNEAHRLPFHFGHQKQRVMTL